jgi:hypothetical protein
MDPVKNLIQFHLAKQNLKRSELATKVGYKSITGGLRKIDEFIHNPRFENPLLLKLQSTLKIPTHEMALAITQRRAYFEVEDRKQFKPFLQTIVSSRPSPIFVAAMVPTLWNIPVDVDLQLLNYDDEMKIVISKYQKLQLAHAENKSVTKYNELVTLLHDYDSNNVSYSWVFGTGFRYFRKYDETLTFNRECILQTVLKTEKPAVAYITL